MMANQLLAIIIIFQLVFDHFICEGNNQVLQQNIRHGRSRTNFLRGTHHEDNLLEEKTKTPYDTYDSGSQNFINITDQLKAYELTEFLTDHEPILQKIFEDKISRNISDPDNVYSNRNDSEEWDDKSSFLDSSLEEVSSVVPTVKNEHVDIVTRFLRIVESQHLLGENCSAGTDLNLGEGVVDRYAQERFRVEAEVAVNRANMLTRLWKYADPEVVTSEYFLHVSLFSMIEFDDDIFAAGNCYDRYQYRDYWLFCPYAYRLPEGPILAKDLAVEYKYLSNTSEWFYIARKNAENVIRNYNQFKRGYHTFTYNETAHTERIADEILSVRYEDGKWSKPYYDCGGGNIWMLTYTVPFFGYKNNTYFFKGTSGIDIDLRRVDIDQCPLPKGSKQLNIFAASDKCKKKTTSCVPVSGLGFRRGSYKCVCKPGFYFPDVNAERRYYNGTVVEEEYEKLMLGQESKYATAGTFECFPCAEGCETCEDDHPCIVALNWMMRTAILILSCAVICCLPVVVLFTWKYGNVKVVRAASPVLLRVITLGAFFIYCTTVVMYPRPNIYTCTIRIWLREIGFSLTYGALMLKTWRISVIFRVRSAKAVKITDTNLLKRLGVIVAIFSVFLVIRSLVAPPVVVVRRTADNLKAYLCRTDWWDHSFTALEVAFLVWGIRLCIVVRKAPSEFNESRFISMAIYNEFLLSLFLNISMLFLQKPANPDLLYIIFFCHTQLTVTLLLGLIFGSKAYMVFKGHDKTDESSGAMISKSHTSKFIGRARISNSLYTSTNSSGANAELNEINEEEIKNEFQRLYTQLEMLRERNMRFGNRHLVLKIAAMQEAASRFEGTNVQREIYDVVVEGQLPKDNTKHTKHTSISFVDTIDEEVQSNNSPITLITKTITENEGEEVISIKSGDESLSAESKLIKSGHAKTHSIVINLDDKSRFTEEVSV
ncbi:probable G-protein coupled receptor 158 [Agrilus planipennis]|uniref:Probable G-protein coupled receptor 158 n=1 Tax=Agrilus planipennis TaxID=224129 RepID=A0A7F5RFG1_AGRPL|nr:probable G-protein coupled receptor 158 [Agrilus planipennis]